jgi:predicted DNA-binding transcriptional regulator AlpA
MERPVQQLFKLEEVCAMLSMTSGGVRNLVRDGHLAPGHKIPGQRGVRWFRLDIENFLDKMRRYPDSGVREENSS